MDAEDHKLMHAVDIARRAFGDASEEHKRKRWAIFTHHNPDWAECTGDDATCDCELHRSRRVQAEHDQRERELRNQRAAEELHWMRQQLPRAVALGLGAEWLGMIRETERMAI